MKKADQFIFPTAFTGTHPSSWAGYTFLQWTTQNAFHPGIDWNWGAGDQDYGNPVQCIANGEVVHQSRQDGIGYGVIVVVRHELTDELARFVKSRYRIDTSVIYSFYAHLKDEIVSNGQELGRGDLLGYVGKSGTKVSHLHGELYKPIPGTRWRYWPTLGDGWDGARLKEYYIDQYDFVENQPTQSDSGSSSELEISNHDRDRNHNDRMALYEELGFTGDFNRLVSVEEIRSLRNIKQRSGEKDEAIQKLQEDLRGVKEELRLAREALEEIKRKNDELDLIEKKLDSTVDDVGQIEKKIDIVSDDMTPKSGWAKIMEGILQLFGK